MFSAHTSIIHYMQNQIIGIEILIQVRVKPGKDSVPLAGGLFNRYHHHHCHHWHHHRNYPQGGLPGGFETTIRIFKATLGPRSYSRPYLSCLMMVAIVVIVLVDDVGDDGANLCNTS